MYFVLFAGSVPTDKRPLSGKYYETLQPLVHEQDGFIEETPFGDPEGPNKQLLYAKFADSNALERWRNNTTHLRLMHHARHNIFDHYHITVSSDQPPPKDSPNVEDHSRIVVVYQRPAGEELHPEVMLLSHISSSKATGLVDDSKFYAGEKLWMWVLRLTGTTKANELESCINRKPEDSMQRMYVVRDYSKDNRREAPAGIDQAEAEAGRNRHQVD